MCRSGSRAIGHVDPVSRDVGEGGRLDENWWVVLLMLCCVRDGDGGGTVKIEFSFSLFDQ